MNLKAPIYFSTGLTEKANHYYKLFITWTNQKIRKTFVQRNMFEFKHIKAFDRAFADNPGPMVGGVDSVTEPVCRFGELCSTALALAEARRQLGKPNLLHPTGCWPKPFCGLAIRTLLSVQLVQTLLSACQGR